MLKVKGQHHPAGMLLYIRLLYSLLGAGVFLLIFEAWINDFIAMPLRVLSTSISEFVVSCCGYDVIREGTSLVVGTFRFNVDLACSGSKTLQQMIAAAIILAGIWGGLTLTQKVLAVLVSIPIALVANGLRVSALMLASIQAGSGLQEDTFAHQFIGVVAFALALLCFWQVCRYVILLRCWNFMESFLALSFKLVLVAIIFFPFLSVMGKSWLGAEWNPYNRYAWIFALLSLLLFGIGCKNRSAATGEDLTDSGWSTAVVGYLLLSAGLISVLVFDRLGFVAVQGGGLLVFVAGCLLLFAGWRELLQTLPLLFIFALSFPRVPLVLKQFIFAGSGYNWAELFLLRVFLAVVLTLLYLFLKRRSFRGAAGKAGTEAVGAADLRWRRSTVTGILLLIFTGAELLWQGMESQPAHPTGNVEYRLFAEVPAAVETWKGKKVEISAQTRELLGGTAAQLWVYTSDYALPVEFFYNFSGRDRHRLHPPEYCLTGAGWVILSKKTLSFTDANGGEIPITVMELRNGEEIRWFAFWFFDGKAIKANYVRMLGEDLLARLEGEVREWSIYRVIAYREEDLKQFVSGITGLLRDKSSPSSIGF